MSAPFSLRHLSVLLLAIISTGCANNLTAVQNVTLIAGDGSDPRSGVTVLVEGDTIRAVGQQLDIPGSANIIDGSGKFLVPGLWDMHVHLSKTRPSAMRLLVANGVTSVRDMGGDIDELLRWRTEVATGQRTGPTIYTAGSYLESPANIERMLAKPVAENVEPVTRMRIGVANPEHARDVVASLASRGVDLIKVRESVNAETFVAIGQAARDHGLALMAHTMEVPLDKLLDARIASIEHFFIPFLDDMPEEQRRYYFESFADQGVAFVPNLYLFTVSELTENADIQHFLDQGGERVDPRRAYISKYMLKDWQEQLDQDRSDDRKGFFRRLMPSLLRDIREMRAAGVKILPGTDTAVVFIFPGWALQEEIALYVDLLGFKPQEAIEAATRETAEFMGVGNLVGTISPGKRADMLLLNSNPLQDIRNTRDIDSVILRGRVLDRDALDSLLAETANEPDIIEDDWGRYP